MAYTSRFNELDLLIPELQALAVPGIDPIVSSTFVGVIAVKAVTAYELAIKDILEEFSEKKHKVFGFYVKMKLERLNGKIMYSNLKGELVKAFGEKYNCRFQTKIQEKTVEVLARERVDLVNTYNNLIQCRNQLVHHGVITLTFYEVVKAYQLGKIVLEALDGAMKR